MVRIDPAPSSAPSKEVLDFATSHKTFVFLGFMAGTTGLEPATSAVTGQRSNQLSYVPRCASRKSYGGDLRCSVSVPEQL